MGFFKQNPLFSGLVALFLLLFIAGVVFIFMASGSASDAKKAFARAESSYRSALALNPAATPANLQASEENVEKLAKALEAQVATTKGSAPFIISQTPPTTEAAMLFQLEAFKEQFTKDAAMVVPFGKSDDEPGIGLPEDFNFGFSRFLEEGDPPPTEFIPIVFEQKEILAYLLRKLYDSKPNSIESVQREMKEEVIPAETQPGTASANNRPSRDRLKKDEFEVGKISAQVPGAIETLGFRIVFTGYTQSLRLFLKQLEEFELPLVVRSVEVEPFQEQVTLADKKDDADNPFAIFGVETEEPTQEELEAATEPLIEDILSQFTVVVEHIQVLVDASGNVASLEANADSEEQPL